MQPIGLNSTISVADINNDGLLEYLVGNSRGGLMMYSDSAWNPGTATLGITSVEPANRQLRIYPNPARDYVTCASPQQDFVNPQTELFDVLGEKMNVETSLNNHQVNINTSQLSNGFYVVRIVQQGQIFTGKVLVEK